jgi:hypothetical protein
MSLVVSLNRRSTGDEDHTEATLSATPGEGGRETK